MRMFFTKKRRALLLLVTVMVSISVHAADFVVNGISYKITDQKGFVVAVTSGDTKYTGRVVIPATVSYNGQSYTVKAIGNNAFDRCTDLTAVVVGSNVESIGYRAFAECTSLTDINWSNSIKSYGSSAFSGCTSLTHVELSSSLDSMDGSVFSGCVNVTSVTINDGCAVIGESTFYHCYKLQAVKIPNSVTTMKGGAFRDCTSLVTVSIGDGVTAIGSNTFDGCLALETVRIGPKVTSIGYRAFGDCTALTSFTSYSVDVPTLETSSFPSKSFAIYVPAVAVDAYKKADTWSKYASQISAISTAIYLTLKQGNGGAIKLQVSSGERYTLAVQPPAGGNVKSVTFNGTDVTGQIVDNTYLTPAITDDAELHVVYDTDSGIPGDLNGDLKVNAADVVKLVNMIMSIK